MSFTSKIADTLSDWFYGLGVWCKETSTEHPLPTGIVLLSIVAAWYFGRLWWKSWLKRKEEKDRSPTYSQELGDRAQMISGSPGASIAKQEQNVGEGARAYQGGDYSNITDQSFIADGQSPVYNFAAGSNPTIINQLPQINSRERGEDKSLFQKQAAAQFLGAEDLFEQGIIAQEQGDFLRAEAAFREAIKKVNIPSLHLALGTILIRQNQFAEAINEMDIACEMLTIVPDDYKNKIEFTILQVRSMALSGLGETDASIETISLALGLIHE